MQKLNLEKSIRATVGHRYQINDSEYLCIEKVISTTLETRLVGGELRSGPTDKNTSYTFLTLDGTTELTIHTDRSNRITYMENKITHGLHH